MVRESIWRLILPRLISLGHIGMWIKISRSFSGVGLDNCKVHNCCYWLFCKFTLLWGFRIFAYLQITWQENNSFPPFPLILFNQFLVRKSFLFFQVLLGKKCLQSNEIWAVGYCWTLSSEKLLIENAFAQLHQDNSYILAAQLQHIVYILHIWAYESGWEFNLQPM